MKKCNRCGKEKEITEFYKNRSMKDGRLGQCKVCKDAYDKDRQMTWGREKRLMNQKRYKQRERLKVIIALGEKCECCGETNYEFLQVDHINGGGRKHRIATNQDVYRDIIKQGIPKDKFRILCANCNFSLGMYGHCPHNNKEKSNELKALARYTFKDNSSLTRAL